jgi:small subunit ribosomal protein S9
MNKSAYFYANGRRKNAVATVRLFLNGKGDFSVNEQKVRVWSDTDDIFRIVNQPLNLLDVKNDFDLAIRVSGGGKRAQSEAISLGISRAVVLQNSDYREQLKKENLLTRDSRKKERKKPGLRKARRSPQWSKR